MQRLTIDRSTQNNDKNWKQPGQAFTQAAKDSAVSS
jgi:hypothetical protein